MTENDKIREELGDARRSKKRTDDLSLAHYGTTIGEMLERQGRMLEIMAKMAWALFDGK